VNLSFRRLTAGDLEVANLLHGDPATNLHNPYGADPDPATTQIRLDEWLRHWDEYGFGYELIEEDGAVIGICGVRRDVWQGLHVLNLYWRLLPSVWGRGYATIAGQHALEMARAARHREPIVARMLAGNAASARVAEKLGMTRRDDLDASVDGADWVLYVESR
jgi:ribosomal-protein-alanine N-acetyltransferase